MASVTAEANPPSLIGLVCNTEIGHNTAGTQEGKNTHHLDIDTGTLTLQGDLPEFFRGRQVTIDNDKIYANFKQVPREGSINLDRHTGAYKSVITEGSKSVIEEGHCVLTDNRKF
jgi:hypothetical protein